MGFAESVNVFVSYAHEDEKLRRELDQHLKGLERTGVVRTWHDRLIVPGQSWAGEIDRALDDSQLVLLLVSKSFLASDYCFEKELTRALERHTTGSCTVIPVILSPCDWGATPFARLQALPLNARPIVKFRPHDEGWLSVIDGIKRALEHRRNAVARDPTTAPVVAEAPVGHVTLAWSETELLGSFSGRKATGATVDVSGGPDCHLTYRAERLDGRLTVHHGMPYLEEARAGRPLKGLLYTWSPFAWRFPALNIRVASRGALPLHLAEAVLHVRDSTPILEPIPVFTDMTRMAIELCNEGWAPLEDAELEFKLSASDAEEGAISLFEEETFTVALGSIAERAQVSLAGKVPPHLANTETAVVTGSLRYTAGGQARKNPFRTRVLIGQRIGRGVKPSAEYSVLLTAGQAPTTRLVPLAQEIGPGETDLFSLVIGSDRSASYELDLSLNVFDAPPIALGDIRLEIFVPRSRRIERS